MKQAAPGEVYYGRYQFADGGSSTKFILVLYANAIDDKVITCIATSVSVDKNKKVGCQPKTQRFLIPANTDYFEKDTFLELLRLKEFFYRDFCLDVSIDLKFALNAEIFLQIKDCLKKLANDIPSDLLPLIKK